MPNIQHHLYKIEVHPIYSHQNMTQQCQKWPLQNHCRAKWGLSKCIFLKNTMLNPLFCRQSWGLNWWPCTGSRGVSTSLFCRENDHGDNSVISTIDRAKLWNNHFTTLRPHPSMRQVQFFQVGQLSKARRQLLQLRASELDARLLRGTDLGGSIRGYPNGWLVYFMENPNLKGMIQGYHEVPRSFGNLHVSFKAIQTRHGTENG